MGMKDSIEHKVDELTGKAKQVVGDLTGNRDLTAEGEADEAQGKLGQAGDRVADAGQEVAGAARDAAQDVKDAFRS